MKVTPSDDLKRRPDAFALFTPGEAAVILFALLAVLMVLDKLGAFS
jgi:hypothetical protein